MKEVKKGEIIGECQEKVIVIILVWKGCRCTGEGEAGWRYVSGFVCV